MPGTSSIAHWALSAPTATIGHVLPTLLIARTTCTSVAPVSAQPTSITVTPATPYAASLLPK